MASGMTPSARTRSRRTAHRSYRPRNRATITFRYRPQFGVIIICPGEDHQRRLYNRLQREGHACRVVTV